MVEATKSSYIQHGNIEYRHINNINAVQDWLPT